jgi:hypothetical protein
MDREAMESMAGITVSTGGTIIFLDRFYQLRDIHKIAN